MTKILIVDDSPDFRSIIETTLSRAGYETAAAVDGEDGLYQAIVHQPDLILLDYMMPKKNGVQVFHELRENANLAHIPVILVTAFATQFADQEMADVQFLLDDFITKPISGKELVARIEAVLSTRRISGMQP